MRMFGGVRILRSEVGVLLFNGLMERKYFSWVCLGMEHRRM